MSLSGCCLCYCNCTHVDVWTQISSCIWLSTQGLNDVDPTGSCAGTGGGETLADVLWCQCPCFDILRIWSSRLCTSSSIRPWWAAKRDIRKWRLYIVFDTGSAEVWPWQIHWTKKDYTQQQFIEICNHWSQSHMHASSQNWATLLSHYCSCTIYVQTCCGFQFPIHGTFQRGSKNDLSLSRPTHISFCKIRWHEEKPAGDGLHVSILFIQSDCTESLWPFLAHWSELDVPGRQITLTGPPNPNPTLPKIKERFPTFQHKECTGVEGNLLKGQQYLSLQPTWQKETVDAYTLVVDYDDTDRSRKWVEPLCPAPLLKFHPLLTVW